MKSFMQRYSVISLLFVLLLTLASCRWGKEKSVDADSSKTTLQTKTQSFVKEITSKEEFLAILDAGKGVIAKFHAVWCPPCRHMKPLFEKMAEKYHEQLNFVSLDTDNPALQDIIEQYVHEGIPFFVGFNNCAQQIFAHAGTYEEKELEEAILRHISQHCKK